MKEELVALLFEKPNIDFSLFDTQNNLVKWVQDYFVEYGVLPTIELFQHKFFPDSPALVPSAPWAYFKEQLEQSKLVRELQPVLSEFGSKYSENPFKAVTGLIEKAIQRARDCAPTGEVLSLKNGKERWDKFISPKTKRINTGIQPLDEACGGISCDDEFMIISARLGVGKSWIGHYILLSIAQHGYRVGLYSGEMSEHEVGARLDSLLAHVSNFELTRGKYTDFDALQKAWEGVRGEILILTTKQLHRNARPSDIRRFVVDNKLDIVILDQLSLMEADGVPHKELFQNVAQLSLQLKTLQQELRVPLVAISQLNREAEGQDASAANISGSDRLGQDATLVLTLARSKTEPKELKIKVVKARSFKIPDKPWEFEWDIDKGYLKFQKSKFAAIKASISTDTLKKSGEDEEDSDLELINGEDKGDLDY